jgi:hypothetical protein
MLPVCVAVVLRGGQPEPKFEICGRETTLRRLPLLDSSGFFCAAHHPNGNQGRMPAYERLQHPLDSFDVLLLEATFGGARG